MRDSSRIRVVAGIPFFIGSESDDQRFQYGDQEGCDEQCMAEQRWRTNIQVTDDERQWQAAKMQPAPFVTPAVQIEAMRADAACTDGEQCRECFIFLSDCHCKTGKGKEMAIVD